MKIFFGKFANVLFLLLIAALSAQGQQQQIVVDKMVLTVSDGVRTELITYSDLLWQLALQPEAALDNPNEIDLNEALKALTEQRLIALEAERLPVAAPTENEITDEIRRLVAAFPSATEFESRLRRVGFDSTADPNLRRIIEQRLAINKYLDFRFRSFVVVTSRDEEQFYSETFVADFRRRNPGVVVPALAQIRERIHQQITENRIESEIERFLSEARERAIITSLNPI